ncbi:MAG TPA: hypothetical protein PK170_00485 [Anaerolineae bacterium]|nr:hypothetical protein [Anaerolineae bacterium]
MIDKLSGFVRTNRLDALILVALAGFGVAYSVVYLNPSAHPVEDAAMLMRYAQHLAQGHGIVWNIGEAPVDGATDFLFMAMAAALVKMHLSVETSVRLIGLVSHLLTAIIIFLSLRRGNRSGPWIATFCALFFLLGPGLGYVDAFFGTPYFALFVALTWYYAIAIAESGGPGPSLATALAFSVSGLIMGLIRPEGVFLAGLMLLSVVYFRGLAASKGVVVSFALIFCLLGGVYFLWRWSYFGYPLPNPFYKKGGGYLYGGSLLMSLRNVRILFGPLLLLPLLGLRSRQLWRRTVFSLIPIVGFTLIWILLSGEMNYLMRFQYPLLPIALMAWPPLVNGIRADFRLPQLQDLAPRTRAAALAIVSGIALVALLVQHGMYRRGALEADGRYDVAVMLNRYADRNYTIATTEAGLLPLYSEWTAVDAWGLNDSWIAHQGQITSDYLSLYHPEVIMFHGHDYSFDPARADQPWSRMVQTLHEYAEQNGYRLAAALGETPKDLHYYYVRPDFPDSKAIFEQIRDARYAWWATGRQAVNFALPLCQTNPHIQEHCGIDESYP